MSKIQLIPAFGWSCLINAVSSLTDILQPGKWGRQLKYIILANQGAVSEQSLHTLATGLAPTTPSIAPQLFRTLEHPTTDLGEPVKHNRMRQMTILEDPISITKRLRYLFSQRRHPVSSSKVFKASPPVGRTAPSRPPQCHSVGTLHIPQQSRKTGLW